MLFLTLLLPLFFISFLIPGLRTNVLHNYTDFENRLIEELRSSLEKDEKEDPDSRLLIRSKAGNNRRKIARRSHAKSKSRYRFTSGEEQQVDQRDHKIRLSSLYECDYFDDVDRICVTRRQLGTTLTIGVLAENANKGQLYLVRWFRFFKVRDSNLEIQEEFTKDSRPWNINIAGDGRELRISPVTETDFGYNTFVAFLANGTEENKQESKMEWSTLLQMKFMIEPTNIAMGSLYLGEELMINARAFMELPRDSVQFEWGMRRPDFRTMYGLPSSMIIKPGGNVIAIEELGTSEDMVLTCAVYSNKNVFVARRNFFLHKTLSAAKSYEETTVENEDSNFKRRKKRSYEDRQPYGENSLETEEDVKDREYHLPPGKRSKDFHRRNKLVNNVRNFDYYETLSPGIGGFWETPYPNYTPNRKHVKSEARHQTPFLKREDTSLESGQLPSVNEIIETANVLVQAPDAKKRPQFQINKANIEERITFDDRESKLISDCRFDTECSFHATCYRMRDESSFCRCLPGYVGNGLFCWFF